LPYCSAHRLPDKKQEAACVAAMQAFNAPYSMMMLEIDAVGMYDTAADEMGGGGTTRASTVAIAKRGVRNLLVHAGILKGRLEQGPTLMLDMPDNDCFTLSEQ